MGNLTIRADDDLIDALDAEADDRGISRAALVRECLRTRNAPAEHTEALESQLRECETECERLRNEKRQLLARREEHTSLVEAVERDATLAEQRADAGALTRFRWWALGRREGER